MQASMIGLDLAKNIFQLHGVDASGNVVLRKRLRRGQVERFFAALAPAVVGMEACGGAHHWARRLQALGHAVRLLPPAYVKPYVKRNKTDGRDAEAIPRRRMRRWPAWRGTGRRSTPTSRPWSGASSRRCARTVWHAG